MIGADGAAAHLADDAFDIFGRHGQQVDLESVTDPTAQSVDSKSVLGKAALILDAFAADSPALSFSDFCERTGLPRSTVHRMLEQLVAYRWLERIGNQYQLGTRMFEFGFLVRRCYYLREVALPFMEDLYEATHETVHLGALVGRDVLYLDKIGGHDAHQVPSRIGGKAPAHCTGLGKAMLAFAGEEVIADVVNRGLIQMTPSTIVDPIVFSDEMRTIRELGVAFDREEAVPGITCVAVPIRGSGRAVAALSITGPSPRINVDRLSPAIRTAARGIWRVMFPSRG
ncbi:MAG: IclR family transcriptional regulator [Acidimicrobiales bacterium]|jgi:DNA-binding IclR family transcriptional regulator|nr:IclR family transcriptional regulator [Acidimicrobiales bacterium]